MTASPPWSMSSRIVSAGRPTGAGQPLNSPLVPASTFVHGGEFTYARDEGTPTWAALEQVMAELEGGYAHAFASGMAAVAAVFDQLPADATIVWPDDCYQGVAGLIERGEQQSRWTSRRLALSDTAGWIAAARTADLLWLESPSNPLLTIADIPAIAAAPRKAGALLVVDNTLATPLNQRPLELGADVSLTSATKFIGGHSDLLCGVTVSADADLAARIGRARLLHGATPGTLEAFLALRGVRTLAVRLERAQASAQILAERLSTHQRVATVRYPGLSTHEQHDLAADHLGGFGTIVTFDVTGGAAAADACLERLALIVHATSFGSVESTIERRASIPGQHHLPAGLLRLNVGVEDVEDLWRDLDSALGALSRRRDVSTSSGAATAQ